MIGITISSKISNPDGWVVVKAEKRRINSGASLIIVVGARGFEPPTSWSRTKRATKLRYAP